MKALRFWFAMVALAAVLVLFAACTDDAQGTGDTDGDEEFTAFTCETDMQCMRITTNMTCHQLRGVCVDHGLCSDDADCETWYGGMLPYCHSDGICSDSEESKPDGDIPNPDGDTPDGDTPDGDTPDGDEPDGDDDDPWVPQDGDLDYDMGDPEIEFDSQLVPCDHNASLSTPSIVVEPNVADFGAVPIGDSEDLIVTICNAGGADLAITGLKFSRETSNEFYKFHAEVPVTVPPGYATPVLLMYIPMDSRADSGTLEILSNDSNSPQVNVDLISAIKAAPYVRAIPETVQFSGAQSGQTMTKLLELRNVGLASTSITDMTIVGGANSPYKILEVVNTESGAASTAPWTLQPEESLMVTVAMTMGDTPRDDVLVVPWVTDTGERQTRVDLVTGDMAMCAIPVALHDQEVDPLDVVYLDGSQSHDPNGVIQGYKWEWVTKPAEAYRAIILDSNGQNIEGQWTNDPYVNFYAELAGEYIVQLTVKDEEASCTGVNADTVRVIAKPESTIHVQLVWSIPNNDQDLHLIKPGGYHTREEASNVTDCHYTNCNTMNGLAWPCAFQGCPGPQFAPDWGQLGQRFDDATLDIDDIEGSGPENINLSLPELGDYKVTVENYSGSDTNLEVTVRIWIFGTLQETFVHAHWPTQKHWNVCWLRVKDATTIEIIPIDTIE